MLQIATLSLFLWLSPFARAANAPAGGAGGAFDVTKFGATPNADISQVYIYIYIYKLNVILIMDYI